MASAGDHVFSISSTSHKLGVAARLAVPVDVGAPSRTIERVPLPTQAGVRAFARWVTSGGMHVACYCIALTSVPVDFLADPDGSWTYDALVQAAGFAAYEGVAIGALREAFEGHSEGAAVVTLNAETRPYVAIVECPIAYTCVAEMSVGQSSAA